ncbi:MAG: glycosyltransferase [Planctomycetes bacterium]|jgi:glycosyltransferase involved in cell wall biosynthesis|nr:glycosyltransferase [Planctomycetota bacterium]
MTNPRPGPLALFAKYAAMSRQVYREQGGVALLRVAAAKVMRGIRGTPPLVVGDGNTTKEPWAYDGLEVLKPVEVVVIDRDFAAASVERDFAVVVTVRNEAKGLAAFLASVEAQSLRPREFVLVDGGSTDTTLAIAQAFAARHPTWFRVVAAGEVNIAAGRNLGVRAATAPILVFVDAGCQLRPNVFANLVGPFAGERADVICGLFDAARPCAAVTCFVPDWDTFQWFDRFLPSARCMAVRREVFDAAGGFPEHLTRTGEDTLFGLACRRVSARWVISKRARVVWDAPTKTAAVFDLARKYAVGDGESGFGDYHFTPADRPDPRTLRGMQVIGYREGRERRPRIEVEKRRIRGLVVLISGVPLTDIGGGQRATQMALEFTRAGFKVLFLNLYPRYGDQVDKLFFDIDYTLLELQAHERFDPTEFVARYGAFDVPCLVFTEFPHPAAMATVQKLKAGLARAHYVFDYIDLWESSLGGSWYDPKIENEFIALADHLVASARTLQEALAARAGRAVRLVPNAVNSLLFRPDPGLPRPADLPTGKPVVIYVGSLYGEWFDWVAMTAAIEAHPQLCFVFIGDHAAAPRAFELQAQHAHVKFLGPKAQRDLPAYLDHAAVCVIPFRTDLRLTKFVNPLKVYEYLAMARPVVATAMEELEGVPGVALARDARDFAAKVGAAVGAPFDRAAVAAFVRDNDWAARIRALAALVS